MRPAQRLFRLSIAQHFYLSSQLARVSRYSSFFTQRFYCSNRSSQSLGEDMELNSVVSRLDAFAPPKLAEDWDNVGLLVEPSKPHDAIKRILLTSM
jgi:hypothetical protein